MRVFVHQEVHVMSAFLSALSDWLAPLAHPTVQFLIGMSIVLTAAVFCTSVWVRHRRSSSEIAELNARDDMRIAQLKARHSQLDQEAAEAAAGSASFTSL
jgi:hypothetical protein